MTNPLDPQAGLLDRMSEDALLDTLAPKDVLTPAKPVSSKTAHCLLTQTVEMLRADESLAGELRWVVHGLVPEDAFVIVYGGPKVGKGTLVTHMAKCIISGGPFAGRVTQASDVLWLDLEQTRWLTRRKFEEEGAYDQLHQVHIYNGVPPTITAIVETIKVLQPKIVVIDSLSRLLLLEDENSAAEVTAALAPLVDLAHQYRVAVVAIHHARKSEGPHGSGMRGSSAFLAVSDVALEIKRMADDVADPRRKIIGVGRYDEANETIIVRRTEDGYVAEESPAQRRRHELLGLLTNTQHDIGELARKMRVRKSVVTSDLDVLVAAGHVLRLGTGKRGSPYNYTAL